MPVGFAAVVARFHVGLEWGPYKELQPQASPAEHVGACAFGLPALVAPPLVETPIAHVQAGRLAATPFAFRHANIVSFFNLYGQ